MFPGNDSKEPFNRDMVSRVFLCLGKPDATHWPTMVEMPFWRNAKEMDRTEPDEKGNSMEFIPHFQRKAALGAELIARLDKRSAQTSERRHASELTLSMLEFDPLKRATCAVALDSFAFKNVDLGSLTGNVFALDSPPVKETVFVESRTRMAKEKELYNQRKKAKEDEESRAREKSSLLKRQRTAESGEIIE